MLATTGHVIRPLMGMRTLVSSSSLEARPTLHRAAASKVGLLQRGASSAQLRRAVSSSASAPKAAIMVVGDEILAGSITDTNTPWLAKLLYSRGVDLIRAEYVPDNIPEIQETVLRLKSKVGPSGFVFSSGGIGPTHDDVTYEAIAGALGVQLQLHQPTVHLMQQHYSTRGLELNAARLRMATLPTPADEVLVTPGTWVPLVAVQGVHILPGIPKLFQSMITAHQERFSGPLAQSVALYTQAGEGDIADGLRQVAAQHNSVNIGSYPCTQEGASYKVKVVLTSREGEALAQAIAAVREALPGAQFKEDA